MRVLEQPVINHTAEGLISFLSAHGTLGGGGEVGGLQRAHVVVVFI